MQEDVCFVFACLYLYLVNEHYSQLPSWMKTILLSSFLANTSELSKMACKLSGGRRRGKLLQQLRKTWGNSPSSRCPILQFCMGLWGLLWVLMLLEGAELMGGHICNLPFEYVALAPCFAIVCNPMAFPETSPKQPSFGIFIPPY